MDPYDILGIPKSANQEEIKQAYRREAMKWHPDRCNNSSEAKERFHLAAEAYKVLSDNNVKAGNGESKSHFYTEDHDCGSESEYADYYSDSHYANDESEDKFADTIFWEVMLDYAIKLAQTGLNESEIAISISQNGCPQRLAAVIADKAFNIHAHYTSGSDKKRKAGADKSSFKEERLESELHRAFLGQGNVLFSPKHTVEYYLVFFREFRQSANLNPLSRISVNRSLIRILNFSIVFFTVILIAINIFPGPSQYKLLPDITLLQLPLGVLSSMFIWTIYRKLWTFTLILGAFFLATLAFYNSYMPQALNNNLTSVLLIAAICFAPFIFTMLFANYLYYRKAQYMIGQADRLFDNQLDKIIWIKNRSGTSTTTAFMYVVVLVSSLTYVIQGDNEFLDTIGFKLPGMDLENEVRANQKVRLRLKDASRSFEIAESHFNHSPPDYLKAELAYTSAADNGSLLAAYKLGYMYYVGEGVDQNDVLAFDFFEQAIRSPLAFQPHSLQLTTKFLAESYNNLGIMYHGGYGTRKNLKKAYEMYSRGAKFGSGNAKLNLKSALSLSAYTERRRIIKPGFD